MIFTPLDFIRESNRIEGIHREPKKSEISEYERFMALDEINLRDMIQFVSTYQPGAKLREHRGMNVQVGNYFPPPGDITIKTRLVDILDEANMGRNKGGFPPYGVHQRYERLHPFTDGNGRSGRMLWMWMMRSAPLGFLHSWYYQSLENAQEMRYS